MSYLNVVEVESALQTDATNYPSLLSYITLPHKTWENRTCHAVKLANGSGAGRVGVYFIGEIHTRKWVCPDILINFVEQIANAYSTNTGLTFGPKTFSAAQIKHIVDQLDVYIFPQVNPDGRHESFTGDAWWRKNRRPAPASHPTSLGVDINRNYNFLWNYPTHFDPAAPVMNSQDPGDSVYIGPSAASEPETQNVVWMLNQYPNIRYFVDLHSYSELILYDWGDDDDQMTAPTMNFRNSSFDGSRGIAGDTAYQEYISAGDRSLRLGIANRVRDTIRAVRNRVYTVQQPFNLYPTAGASTDFMGGRCFIDAGTETIHGFTFECGREFQPDLAERDQIISEITAGLLEFCLAVLDTPADVYLRDNLQDTGAEPTPSGRLSISPDIHHFRDALNDPQALLGSAAAKQRNDLFETIEKGQNNFIYVRLQNRGSTAATAEIDVYWTSPSTLPTPGSWNLIGTLSIPNVLPGEMTVSAPLTWPASQIPNTGHYCFVAVLGTANDPKPNIADVNTIEEFYDFIRGSNNVAWKNFDIEDQFAGSLLRVDFTIRGWARTAYASDLEIDLSSLDPDATVELKLLKRLTNGANPEGLTKIQDVGWFTLYQVRSGQRVAMQQMSLKPSDHTVATLSIHLPPTTPDGIYDIAAIQRIDGNEVGRVTKRLIVGDHPFVANARFHEVHKNNYPWVAQMSGRNKHAYRDLQLALKHGYNGCHTCLPEHDTG